MYKSLLILTLVHEGNHTVFRFLNSSTQSSEHLCQTIHFLLAAPIVNFGQNVVLYNFRRIATNSHGVTLGCVTYTVRHFGAVSLWGVSR